MGSKPWIFGYVNIGETARLLVFYLRFDDFVI